MYIDYLVFIKNFENKACVLVKSKKNTVSKIDIPSNYLTSLKKNKLSAEAVAVISVELDSNI